MKKQWRIYPHDAERIERLRRAAGIPAVLAQLLVSRGVHDPEIAQAFLQCKLSGLRDPSELTGCTEAAQRICAAIRDKRRIMIYGDYDLDGISATALLYRCLKLNHADVGYYVPSRLEEGYGLNSTALETLHSRGASLVITVDCGICSVAEAETARRLGLELIVTDHHAFGETLPAADVLVHPSLPGREYPFSGLSGAGVAFKLAWAICQEVCQAKRVDERMRNFLLDAVATAALGAVADVVPLVDENRILVRHGLDSLLGRPSIGMTALLKVTGLDKKPSLSSEDIAFTIAPRLNAAGRLGQALLAVELLVTDSQDRATALAEYINELNSSRQSLERSIYLAANKQALEQFDPENDPVLVLADRGWHPGVIGIVANRLVDKFHCPVIMISLDEAGVKPGMGSGRSVRGIDLNAALCACKHHLISCGGHAAAAGLKIQESQVDQFRAAICEHIVSRQPAGKRVPELHIDAEAPLSAFTTQVLDLINRMEPFGHENPRPVICATGVTLAEPPKKMGGGERHLALKLEQHGIRMRAVAFGKADWAEELAKVEGPLEIAFHPVINEFAGRRSVELQLADWRVSNMTESAKPLVSAEAV